MTEALFTMQSRSSLMFKSIIFSLKFSLFFKLSASSFYKCDTPVHSYECHLGIINFHNANNTNNTNKVNKWLTIEEINHYKLKVISLITRYNRIPQFSIHSQTGVTGKIKVNGKNRSSNSQSFRSLAAYIHQDDALRPYLTVSEAMTIATNLKLGYNVTKEYKTSMVCERYDCSAGKFN